MRRRLTILAAALTLAPAWAQEAPGPGHDLYLDHCASCHGQHLDDGQFAPSLKGSAFRGRWGQADGRALQAYVATNMPPGAGGSLATEDYAAIVGYVRASNVIPPSKS